jgi:hypothetical protein
MRRQRTPSEVVRVIPHGQSINRMCLKCVFFKFRIAAFALTIAAIASEARVTAPVQQKF